MKWLPDPSEPSCSRQFGAIASACSTPSSASSSAMRGCASSRTDALYLPADSGTAALIAACRARRSPADRAAELRLDGHHAAADVDAHRGRNDRAEGRDHGADGRALAQVRVRHQRQVWLDERHRRRALGLRTGLVLEDRGEVHQFRHAHHRADRVNCLAAFGHGGGSRRPRGGTREGARLRPACAHRRSVQRPADGVGTPVGPRGRRARRTIDHRQDERGLRSVADRGQSARMGVDGRVRGAPLRAAMFFFFFFFFFSRAGASVHPHARRLSAICDRPR